MRRQDWPERLAGFIDSRRSQPFEWGVNDCSTFAIDAVETMTGARPDLPLVATADEYARMLRDAGSLATIIGDAYGEPIHPSLAQRGDVVLLMVDGRETIAVCLGASAAAPAKDGVETVPMELAVAAWRV